MTCFRISLWLAGPAGCPALPVLLPCGVSRHDCLPVFYRLFLWLLSVSVGVCLHAGPLLFAELPSVCFGSTEVDLTNSSSSSVFPAMSLRFTILGEIFAYVTVFLIQPLRSSLSVFVDGACWVCLYCRHSPV